MADFNIEELNIFLNDLKPNNRVNVEAFVDLFQQNYIEYNSETDLNNRFALVPEIYANQALEFLFLKQLKDSYISGIQQTKFISDELGRGNSINEVLIEDNLGNEVGKLEINSKTSSILNRDLEEMKVQFSKLGEALLGESFNYNIFDNANTE